MCFQTSPHFQATSVTILPFCRRVKVLRTCIMAAACTIAWIIGIVTSSFPLQQIIFCLRMPMTSRRLLHCGQPCVCVAAARRLRIVSFQNVLWKRVGARFARLASFPETERLNLTPQPGGHWILSSVIPQTWVSQRHCKILNWNVGWVREQAVRESLLVFCCRLQQGKPWECRCETLYRPQMRIGIDSRACVRALSLF